jgi:hypothetical protein
LAYVFFWSKVKTEKSITVVVVYSLWFLLLLNSYDLVASRRLYKHIYYLIYTFTEYSFFALIFWENIRQRKFRFFIFIASLFFSIFQVVYFFTLKYKTLDSIPIGIETILIFVYTIYYLYELFKNPEVQYINRTFSFWFVIGIVIYLSGSFFLYILANHVSLEELTKYWNLTYIVDIIKNIFFAIGIYVCAKQFPKNRNQKSMPYLDIDLPPRYN